MKPSVLLYGNCQAEHVAHIAQYVPTLRDKLTFKVIPLHIVTKQDWESRYDAAYFADVKVLWNQVESGPKSEHREMLESRMGDGWQVVNFPPFSMLALWPFAGNEPRLATSTDYRYPWTDSIAASLAGQDLPDDELFDRYMQITSQKMPDLERRLRMDVGRWRASDDLSDIKLADWVLDTFRDRQIFYTSGHVTAEPLGRLLKQLIERTGLLTDTDIQRAKIETDFLLRHYCAQDLEVAPLHPLVAERLRISYYDPAARYRWHGHEWTFREYILKYIRWEPFLE